MIISEFVKSTASTSVAPPPPSDGWISFATKAIREAKGFKYPKMYVWLSLHKPTQAIGLSINTANEMVYKNKLIIEDFALVRSTSNAYGRFRFAMIKLFDAKAWTGFDEAIESQLLQGWTLLGSNIGKDKDEVEKSFPEVLRAVGEYLGIKIKSY